MADSILAIVLDPLTFNAVSKAAVAVAARVKTRTRWDAPAVAMLLADAPVPLTSNAVSGVVVLPLLRVVLVAL